MIKKEDYPEFAILMSTYNGEKFLSRQLLSFLEQTNRNWRLYVSDDGSSDRTLEIICKLKNRIGEKRIKLRQGPKTCFAKNFMSLINDENINAQYYVLADQDDIWEKDKLVAALEYFRQINSSIPALYCGRTIFVSEENEFINLSEMPKRPLNFCNSLVQNIASGNTMIFNQAARDLIIKCGKDVDVSSHDWWVYILVTACGGHVFYDTKPYVRYRQHNNNLIGMNSNLSSKFKRWGQVLRGDFRKWNDNNIKALENASQYLTNENKKTLDIFSNARCNSGPVGIFYLIKSRVYRQKFTQNVALYIAGFFGKL